MASAFTGGSSGAPCSSNPAAPTLDGTASLAKNIMSNTVVGIMNNCCADIGFNAQGSAFFEKSHENPLLNQGNAELATSVGWPEDPWRRSRSPFLLRPFTKDQGHAGQRVEQRSESQRIDGSKADQRGCNDATREKTGNGHHTP